MNEADGSRVDQLSSEQAHLFAEACQAFKEALSDGSAPRIESYIERTPQVPAPVVLEELLLIEIDHRTGRGEHPRLDEYRNRFPEHIDLVVAVFDSEGVESLGFGSNSSLFLGQTIGGDFTQGSAFSKIWDPTASTVSFPGPPDNPGARRHPVVLPQPPRFLGRYRIEGLIGEGGFGRVFKAFDTDLQRHVAIKVPHPHRIPNSGDVQAYLAEPRIVAGLDHPGIVPIYDVGRTPEGIFYIVSKYIEGGDLAQRQKLKRLDFRGAAGLIASVAEALHHAHSRGLVHRDIKGGNLLLDHADNVYVADFGLALREEDFGKAPVFAGTLKYMSPEQARGEGHLVDGRSDVFSLGVVFYDLLTGELPFRAEGWDETIEEITSVDPPPPRQVNADVPKELDRICLRALAKRLSDRYATAQELCEDLRDALAQRIEGGQTFAFPAADANSEWSRSGVMVSRIRIVPKGLRSFDAEDADFFLGLLPGARDRHGLPESLRFWKSRIERSPSETTFRVGLVYGPSGSGKSSLIRAGLVPRLNADVGTLLVEATSHDTETRLRRGLEAFGIAPAPDASLTQLLTSIRLGHGARPGQKLLLVFDQFEQWLQANRSPEETDLVHALRQCDGANLQCLIIVRDDFWMSVTRFFQKLEVPLLEGENCCAVDLFELRHAKKVLAAYGRAFDILPEFPSEPDLSQLAFIDQAVSALASDEKIVAVQLSLFAEMVKEQPWSPDTLRDVGGTAGIGVAFLEQTFEGSASLAGHRLHQKAAREVLKALLPEHGIDLKAYVRPQDELLAASGYSPHSGEFDSLIRTLDNDLRLITPIDPRWDFADEAAETAAEPRYQLSHDYLVPAVREWLSRRQRETRRGRAEIRLADRAALWSSKREAKQLPSLWEWFEIRFLTRKSRWEPREADLMNAAAIRLAIGGALIGLATFAVGFAVVEGVRTLRARALLDRLVAADTANVPEIVAQLGSYRTRVNYQLQELRLNPRPNSRDALHANLALLPVEPARAADLTDALLSADPTTVRVLRETLAPHRKSYEAQFWTILQSDIADPNQRLRCACALALIDPASPRWQAVGSDLASILVKRDVFAVAEWGMLLFPVRESLIPPLRKLFLDDQTDQKGYIAASLLAEYTSDNPDALCELIRDATARQLKVLLSHVGPPVSDRIVRWAKQLLADPLPTGQKDKVIDKHASQKANAALAISMFRGPEGLWPLLTVQPDPRVRSYLIDRMPPFGITPANVIDALPGQTAPSVRQAMILILGSFESDQLPLGPRRSIAPRLAEIYPGGEIEVRAAIAWTLGQWSMSTLISELNNGAQRPKPPENRASWTTVEGHRMISIKGPVTFEMGRTGTNSVRDYDQPPHPCTIGRSFAVASKEVTVRQFQNFPFAHEYDESVISDKNCPMNCVTFYDAARYCRWLSEMAGMPEDQMCFPKVDEIKAGFCMIPNYLSRKGFRLPTEPEFEFVYRAGTNTASFYGSDAELMNSYAWNGKNCFGMRPVGTRMPNPWGFFDLAGNAYERTMNFITGTQLVPGPAPFNDVETLTQIKDQTIIVLRGGAFHLFAADVLASGRAKDGAADRNRFVGFRIAQTID